MANGSIQQVLRNYSDEARIVSVHCDGPIWIEVVNADNKIRKDFWVKGNDSWITSQYYGPEWFMSHSYVTKDTYKG